MRRALAALALLLVVAAPAGAARPAPDGAAIAFASTRAGRAAIWTVDVDRVMARRITMPPVPVRPCRCSSGDADARPAWSRDGERIAFTRGARIVVAAADGSGARAVPGPDGAEDTEPAWSTRGRLAFVREHHVGRHRYEIVSADGAGGGQRVLLASSFRPRALAWSPRGRRLAYAVPYRDPALPFVVGLFHLGEAGGPPRFVLRSVGIGEVGWSPDGTTLVFASSVPGADPFDPYRIFTVRLSDTRIVQLTEHIGSHTADALPRWSPDGRQIVFVRTDRRGSSIRSVTPDGRAERLLAADATGPVLSPDGSRIGFVDGLSGRRRPLSVSVMRRDGSRKRTLVMLRRPADAVELGPQSWRRPGS